MTVRISDSHLRPRERVLSAHCGRQSTKRTSEKQSRSPKFLYLGYPLLPSKDFYHVSHYVPLFKLILVGAVLLLAANDTLPNATLSYDSVTRKFTVPFNKSQCLVHTVGPESERKLSSNLWQQHTSFKSQFAMKFRYLDGTVRSLNWKKKEMKGTPQYVT